MILRTVAILALLAPAVSSAQDAAGAKAAVGAFHEALARADRSAALATLLPEVVIFESGEVELTRDEYASHHLAADMEFSAATKEEVVSRSAAESGDIAWVLTRSRTKGKFHDKSIDVEGTETMLLRRTADGWRIFHIHWSSHRRAA